MARIAWNLPPRESTGDGYGNEYVELRVEAAAYEAMTSEGTYALGDGCLVEVLERDGGETPGRGDMAK